MIVREVKKEKGIYNVKIDDNIYQLELDVILNHNLFKGKELTKEKLEEIIIDDRFFKLYKLALKKLKKAESIYNMEKYLLDNSEEKALIGKVMKKLIEKKYLNDDVYTKMYIENNKNKYGKKMITINLEKNGINRAIIDAYISYDENTIIEKLVKSEISKVKNKTKKIISDTILKKYINKGFSYSLLKENIANYLLDINVNQDEFIEIEYEKMHKKYNRKLDGYQLEMKIKNKLYENGFEIDKINDILQKKRT